MAETSGDRGFREGAVAVVPMAVAVFGFGLSYGVLARAAGMGGVAPVVMSVTTFAGSAQFAAASVLQAGGAAATAALSAIMLNARYLPIGVTVAPWLEGGVWSRLLHAHLTVDESWVIAAEGTGRWNPRVLLAAGMGLWIAWILGTLGGVLFGNVIGDPTRLGLDAAFPALFLALLVPQLRSRERVTKVGGFRIGAPPPAIAALIGAAIAVALTPFTPSGVPIVAAGAACLIGAALVAIGTFADGQRLVLDGRVLGVGAAAVAIRFRAPVLLVVIIAAAVTATARAFAG
ncbi:MAG: AzlC family ABC transporter permease [Actinobacteria bacterium]|nr:MAG: AzlC family ABC transporter permease [Actinomycetota bacterium]